MRAFVPAASGSALSRAVLRIGLIAVLAVMVLSGMGVRAESAHADYKRGQNAEDRQDYDAAFNYYQLANNKDPKDLRYRSALYRVRISAAAAHVTKGRKLLAAGDEQGALAEFLHANEIDPADEAAMQGINRVRQKQGTGVMPPQSGLPEPASEQEEINSLGAPPELKPISNEPLTLHMTQDAKVIYEAVGKAAGINVLFDPDYNSKRIQVDLNNVSLLDALRILGTMSDTFWRPVTSNTIFVAQNTRIKRTELDEQAVQTFYLTNAWQPNDMNDVQTALRSVLPNARFFGVASQNAIVARGTPDELLLAQKLIDDLDKARPEVVVDIGVLEVSKNWERDLGMSWPSSVGVSIQPPCSSSSSSSCSSSTSTSSTSSSTTTPTLYDLSHLKASDFAVNVGSATLNLLLNDDNTQILQNPRIRATDDQKATLTIGSKIPEATGSYQTGAATALVSSLVNTQFQYIDVGVKIEMTPTVHYDDDVTLKIHIEVTAQSGSTTISGVTEPIISQRIIDQVIRLHEGEASILGGIRQSQNETNWSGIPGLSAIPILKYLFGSNDHTIQDDDIVFVVVPHIVRSEQLDEANMRPIDTGTGQSVDLRFVPQKNQSPPASGVQPTSYERPNNNVGVVPGQTAEAAAPAALAEMRALGETVGNPGNSPPSSPAANQPAVSPPPNTPPVRQGAPAAPGAAPPAGAGPTFTLRAPTAPVASGSSFQVPVVLAGGANVDSVPLQLHYDSAYLSLVNVTTGDFLSPDKQAVALVHRDDGPGNVTIVASRPPGAAGVSGTGVVCVLTFQAKAPGSTVLAVTRADTVNNAQQQVAARNSQVSITVK